MKTILIIEDDKDIIDILTIFLSKQNYNVVATENGLEGLTMIKFLKPDLIIVDLIIPGIQGKNLIKKIRENIYMHNKMVLVISGNLNKHYEGEKSDEYDAQALFSKPINLKKLGETISENFSRMN